MDVYLRHRFGNTTGEVRESQRKVTGEIAESLCYRVANRRNGGQPLSRFQYCVTNRAPFRTVAVQQGLVCITANDESKFPAKVDSILHAGIHALPACGAVNVRSVSGKKRVILPIACNLSAIYTKAGQPDRIVQLGSSRPTLIDELLHLIECRRRRC